MLKRLLSRGKELYAARQRRIRSMKIPDNIEAGDFFRDPTGRNPYGIPENIVRRWSLGKPLTPDYGLLLQHKYQLVFIADELQTGHRANGVLQGVFPLYNEAFTERPYVLLKVHAEEQTRPALVNPEDDTNLKKWRKRAMVKGQVFQLTPDELVAVDTYKRNTVDCRRSRVPILIEQHVVLEEERDGWTETALLDQSFFKKRMWVYFDNFIYWSYQQRYRTDNSLLKSRPNNGAYVSRYSFTRNDW